MGTQENLNRLPLYDEMCSRFSLTDEDLKTLPDRLKTLLAQCASNEKTYQKMRQKTYRWFNLWRLWEADGRCCYICRKPTEFNKLTADHVFPRSHGYTLRTNTMPACGKCNTVKGNDLPELDTISRVCAVYDKAGMVFDPHTVSDESGRQYQRIFGVSVSDSMKGIYDQNTRRERIGS